MTARRTQPHKHNYITIYMSPVGRRQLDALCAKWSLGRGKVVEKMLRSFGPYNDMTTETFDDEDEIESRI